MNATPLQKHAVWQLIKPFWVSEERWRAWMMLIAIVILSLGLVYISVLINQWNQVFYDALQNKNYPVFKAQLWRFTYLALIFIVLAVYKIYLTQGLQMRWRRWMTEKFMGKWLAHQAYYHTEQQQIVDNPDQRIAEDLNVLTQYTLSLSLGLLSSLVTLFSFIDILWHVSGPMTFALGQHAITLSGYMVWFALLYAVLGSLLIWWVGKPLVMLGFNQERYEANFRFGLIRIRENNDAIALYHGEPREAQQLGDRFDTIRSNWWAIMRITRRLNIATNFYSQFAIVFPLLVAAPRYFSGAIQMGGLMQIASAFGQVQGALSWFIDAFNDLADRATETRRQGQQVSGIQRGGGVVQRARHGDIPNSKMTADRAIVPHAELGGKYLFSRSLFIYDMAFSTVERPCHAQHLFAADRNLSGGDDHRQPDRGGGPAANLATDRQPRAGAL